MANKGTTKETRESSGRGLKPRSMPFAGLFLMPVVALAAGFVLHFAVADTAAGLALTTAGLTVLAGALAVVAFLVGRHRDQVIRWMVIITIVLAGIGEVVTVAVGPGRIWTTVFLVVGESNAMAWALTRIDSFRRDGKAEQEPQEDQLTKKLGLENTGFGKAKHFADENGEVTRIEVPVKHGPGETAEVIQGAVPGIESVADQAMGGGVPRGRSRAVPTDGAGASTLVIITKDVLKGLIRWPGPSSPGGCITEPLVSATYEDQQPVLKYIAGGCEAAPNPSSYGYMGMTRTGKTLNAQVNAMEMMSRRNVVIFWFDTVKGAQTVRPLRRGFDVIVANDDPREFRKGMKAVQDLIRWRATKLGECGYRQWTPQCATDPRLMMPALVVHWEECDALCEIAGEEMVFIASKGLSTGVIGGYSLQRADSTSMPTGLRFNVGNWSCFGTGDSYSAGFALSDQTIDAGAHPENWKQSKPGYFYTEGIGIDEQRWPVPAKSFFAEDQEFEAHAEQWGPRMMRLDQGSAEALGDWYAQAKEATARQIADWDAAPMAGGDVHDGASGQPAPKPTKAASTRADAVADRAAEAYEQTVAEVAAEIDEIGDELMADGTYDGVDPAVLALDPSGPVAPLPAGAAEVSWRSSKAEAPTREAAIEALGRALHEIATDPTSDAEEDEDDEWIRRQDDGSALFAVGALSKRYPFRSQPWFSETLKAAAAGEIPLDGIGLEAGDSPGEYRLRTVGSAAMVTNSV